MGNRSYSDEQLKVATQTSLSVAEVCRKLGKYPKGAMWESVNCRIKKNGYDTSHFFLKPNCSIKRHVGGGTPFTTEQLIQKFSLKQWIRADASELRRLLIGVGREYKCEKCKTGPVWMNEPITIHVDHIDGDWSNCRHENMRFLCPNCHSQTKTFGSKNKKK